jgi:DNA uptake protein ComE-like DNA-binding protein
MWEKIRAYLTFTRKERLGILLLLLVVLVLFVLPYFLRPAAGSPDQQAYRKYEGAIRRFSSAEDPGRGQRSTSGNQPEMPGSVLRVSDSLSYSGGDHPAAGGSGDGTAGRYALFYFDPNHTEPAGWRRLGLPDRLVLTITHYLQKHGIFREAADLKKIYGLKEEDYERLAPYVRISKPPAGPSSGPGKGQEWIPGDRNKPPPHDQRPAYPGSEDPGRRDPGIRQFPDSLREPPRAFAKPLYGRKRLQEIDINEADSAQWACLPGIGMRLAGRIVRFRNKLGGFFSVDQVGETFGLPDSVFEEIRPYLHSGSAVLQQISLNAADEMVFRAHPYIGWRLAHAIVQYREQHGPFRSIDELQQLALMDPEKLKKLEPYLEIR